MGTVAGYGSEGFVSLDRRLREESFARREGVWIRGRQVGEVVGIGIRLVDCYWESFGCHVWRSEMIWFC